MKSILRSASLLVIGAVVFVHPNDASAATIYACKLNSLGTLRIVSATTACTPFETKISWNTDGPAGHRDQRDLRDNPAQRELRDYPDSPGHKDRPDLQGPRARWQGT